LGKVGLFKNVQMQGAQITESRGVYGYTLSGAVCSATQQMSVFQQPRRLKYCPDARLLPVAEFKISASIYLTGIGKAHRDNFL